MYRRTVLSLLTLGALVAPALPARAKISIEFDYSLDTNNFFNPNTATGLAARAALTAAARVYEDRIVESNLPAITPPVTRSWEAKFTSPGTGAAVALQDVSVAANTIKIYVGGRSLGGAVGLGGPGGYSIYSTDTSFQNAVIYRGQTGASNTVPSTDFGTWGGAIAFDNTVTYNFNLSGPTAGTDDFLTFATHEIAHVLGLGTAPSWKTYLTAQATPFGQTQYVGPFTGPKAQAVYGGPVPLESVPAQQSAGDKVVNAAHFAPGTMSTVGGVTSQETIMDPDVTIGTRKRVTLLDWAALDDLGWDLAKPGDATADGVIDFNDLVKLAQNYNVTDGQRQWADGDFNYDGNVDFNDLVMLAQGYNTSGVLGSDVPMAGGADFSSQWEAAQAIAAGVPEPTGLGAVALIAIGLGRRRK
jgi:hypothetical protein